MAVTPPNLSHLPWQQLPNTTVQYAAGPDWRGQWWILCRCTVCGPRENYVRPCSRPNKTPEWVNRYASMHAHR